MTYLLRMASRCSSSYPKKCTLLINLSASGKWIISKTDIGCISDHCRDRIVTTNPGRLIFVSMYPRQDHCQVSVRKHALLPKQPFVPPEKKGICCIGKCCRACVIFRAGRKWCFDRPWICCRIIRGIPVLYASTKKCQHIYFHSHVSGVANVCRVHGMTNVQAAHWYIRTWL